MQGIWEAQTELDLREEQGRRERGGWVVWEEEVGLGGVREMDKSDQITLYKIFK